MEAYVIVIKIIASGANMIAVNSLMNILMAKENVLS
jgi:hypothetical protein